MEVRQAYAAESFEWDQVQRLCVQAGQVRLLLPGVAVPEHLSPLAGAQPTRSHPGAAGRKREAAARPRRGVVPAAGRRGRRDGQRLTALCSPAGGSRALFTYGTVTRHTSSAAGPTDRAQPECTEGGIIPSRLTELTALHLCYSGCHLGCNMSYHQKGCKGSGGQNGAAANGLRGAQDVYRSQRLSADQTSLTLG